MFDQNLKEFKDFAIYADLSLNEVIINDRKVSLKNSLQHYLMKSEASFFDIIFY